MSCNEHVVLAYRRASAFKPNPDFGIDRICWIFEGQYGQSRQHAFHLGRQAIR